MSALTIATSGMTATADRFERNATNITRATAGTPMGQSVDLPTEMVDMLMNQTQFEVLANVARRAGEMQKNAVDILA